MVQKIVHKLLRHRHFWRLVDFDELAELYASMLLRSLATSLIGLFVPIYIHGLGYGVRTIFGFYIIFFGARVVVDMVSALVVARIGPKHTMALSTLVNIVFLTLLLTIKELDWPLAFVALVGTATNSLFFVAFHTDFSKIKHRQHGGKELGYVTMLEKIGWVLGPLVGGGIASLWGPRYTIVVAITLFVASLAPLFMSNEPVKTHQHITLKGFRFRPHLRSFAAYAMFNTENVISILLWNFYLALAVFTISPYAKIGAVTAASTAVSLLTVKIVGQLIDKRQGKKLINVSVVLNSIIHLLRLMVQTPLAAIGINMLNDPVTVGYRMPFTKQFYDQSDNVPGYRIVYIVTNEVLSTVLKTAVWVGLYVISGYTTPLVAIRVMFVVAAILSLGIALQPQTYNNHK